MTIQDDGWRNGMMKVLDELEGYQPDLAPYLRVRALRREVDKLLSVLQAIYSETIDGRWSLVKSQVVAQMAGTALEAAVKTTRMSMQELHESIGFEDDEHDEDYYEDDPDKWTCAYPSYCVMPGEHMRSECHTARDCAEFFQEEE